MAREIIQNGAVANDGTGDNLRVTADKINRMFGEMYGVFQFQNNGDLNIVNPNGDITIGAGPNRLTDPAIRIPDTVGGDIKLGTATNPIDIGSPTNPAIQIPAPGTGTNSPIQIGNPNNGISVPMPGDSTTPVRIGPDPSIPTNPGISIPAPATTNPLTIKNPNGPIELGPTTNPNDGDNKGSPTTPGITIPAPGAGGADNGSEIDIRTGKTPLRVVYTDNNGKLEVDENLRFDGNHLQVVEKDMYLQLGTYPGSGSAADQSYGIIWKGDGAVANASTKHYGYIKAEYTNQNMASNSSVVTIGPGTPLIGLDGYQSAKHWLKINYKGHVAINTDETTYGDVHKMTLGRGGMLSESYASVDAEQIFHAWGTTRGNQIYQDASGFKLAQLGNQGKTYWLGHGGVHLNPFATGGARCITWDTDCEVTISNADGDGIVVPSPASNNPITIGNPAAGGISIPRDGTGGFKAGNPGTGAPVTGGSGGANGGSGNAGGTPGISIPSPWDSRQNATNPENAAKLKNPDGPIEIGNPGSPTGHGILIPTPGSADAMTIDTGLTSNRVVWTKPDKGTLGVDDKFKYDGTSAELEAAFKTKYVEFLLTPSYASTFAPDWKLGTVQTMTLTGNITLNEPVDLPVGGTMTVIFKQDGTGSRLISYQSSKFIFASGIKTLTTTANAVDMLNIFNTGVVGASQYMCALTTNYRA
jgi:hypothetical protein